MNKILLYILFCLCLINVEAQDKSVYLDYREVMLNYTPLMQSQQPASIFYNTLDSINHCELSYQREHGDFKPTLVGLSNHSYNIKSDSYKTINKTKFHGVFSYIKNNEQNVSYTNMYDAYRGTPYLYIDTTEHNNINREEFSVKAQLATPLSSTLILGTEVNYRVGLGAQVRDPRSQNKVSDLNINTGLVYQYSPKTRIGFHALYSYYNEDIDLITTDPNATHVVFALTGLGTYSKHESSTFNRLYKGHAIGGHTQIETGINLFDFGYQTHREKAKDGRKESTATWATIKDDSEWNSHELSIKNITTIKDKTHIHQLKIDGIYQKNIGTEILQQLQLVDENTNTYQWYTYGIEDKYEKEIKNISLSYELAHYQVTHLRNYSLSAGVNVWSMHEKYHNPNTEQIISNIEYSIRAQKAWRWQQQELHLKLEGQWTHNIKSYNSFTNTSTITNKLLLPDFDYLSSHRKTIGIHTSYAFPLYQQQIIAQASYMKTFATSQRSLIKMTIGLLF